MALEAVSIDVLELSSITVIERFPQDYLRTEHSGVHRPNIVKQYLIMSATSQLC
jgi:hypothetical protein